MFTILIVAKADKLVNELDSQLRREGFACSVTTNGENLSEEFAEHPPDLALVGIDAYPTIREQRTKQKTYLPVIALVSRERLTSLDNNPDIDDFVLVPYDPEEVVLRVKRLLQKNRPESNGELIKCGDLVIDQAKCEIAIAGHPIVLTFKEYELVKFLASNQGRVFNRETLLNKIWGYDYYGGDRTVDVHIRRLRSKIEDSSHTFIETVRNVGYRFCETKNTA